MDSKSQEERDARERRMCAMRLALSSMLRLDEAEILVRARGCYAFLDGENGYYRTQALSMAIKGASNDDFGPVLSRARLILSFLLEGAEAAHQEAREAA